MGPTSRSVVRREVVSRSRAAGSHHHGSSLAVHHAFKCLSKLTVLLTHLYVVPFCPLCLKLS